MYGSLLVTFKLAGGYGPVGSVHSINGSGFFSGSGLEPFIFKEGKS